jgi:hypothetical protein
VAFRSLEVCSSRRNWYVKLLAVRTAQKRQDGSMGSTDVGIFYLVLGALPKRRRRPFVQERVALARRSIEKNGQDALVD